MSSRVRSNGGEERLEGTAPLRGCLLTLLVMTLLFVLSALVLIALALIRNPEFELPAQFDVYDFPVPVELSDLDGLRCTGEWRETHEEDTAGSITAIFAVDPAGDGGSVTLALSQPVLGGEALATELPFNYEYGTLVIDELDDVLGKVEVQWALDQADLDATFGAPSGAGGVRAVVSRFYFDGSRMVANVNVDSGEGRVYSNGVTATCSQDPE